MLSLLIASIALAQAPAQVPVVPQATVVAVGDELVAGPPAVIAARTAETVPGGWVAVLADCLEERAPRAWTVVDRAVAGETAKSALARVETLDELDPQLVILGLGARELAKPEVDGAALREELAKLLAELRKMASPPGVLLVGLVPPTLSQASGDQGAIDRRTADYNRLLVDLAAKTDGVHHVDLQRDWPQGRGRGALTAEGWRLTDQGHARVAAAVCDAILENWPPKP